MNRKFLLFGLVALIATSMSSCLKTVENRDEEMIAKNEADIKAFLSNDIQGTEAQLDSAGFYYINRNPNPAGQKAEDGNSATIKWTGYLLDGTKVVSSKDSTFTFPVGIANQNLTLATHLAVRKMRVGEKFTVLAPFYIAFENREDYSNIPAYSAMRFEVELLKTRTEVQQIDDFITKGKFEVSERTSENLVIIRNNIVAGDTLGVGKNVTIKYVGKYLDNSKFDEGTLSFTTGYSNLIPGFDKGVRRMRKGEKATIIFPSALGYKNRVDVQIPPYSPLQFELEVQ